jgi:predicted ATPase
MNARASNSAGAPPDPLSASLKLPSGARFYKCALQVNPYQYLVDQGRQTKFKDEATYNQSMAQACRERGIEVAAVTDHHNVKSALALSKALEKAGLHVFRGFEAKSKDGVHLLVLFDHDKSSDAIERHMGECGIRVGDPHNAPGKKDLEELLALASEWGAVCIAAHVVANGGLLTTLQGLTAIRSWQDRRLLACSIAGPVESVPANWRPVLENKNPEYRRERALAIVNAQDVDGPEQVGADGTWCWIKMSSVSVSGLRQAFLDPESRVRLAGDPEPEERAELVAMTWQGGFLDGAGIHFNENLNVLIGGRGAGKSTVIESLRYVLELEPLGDDAQQAHEGVLAKVLQSGTKLSLLVRAHRPAQHEYLIERTIPNPPVVRDRGDRDRVLPMRPRDVIPRVEVYGQHEISELTASPEKLTRLIERFVRRDDALARRKIELRKKLEQSRVRLMSTVKELAQIDEHLAALPAIEETLRRFQDAGLEQRLKERSLLVREDRILKTARNRAEPFREALDQLQKLVPIDRAFLSEKALEDLPGRNTLMEADAVVERLSAEIGKVCAQQRAALERFDQGLTGVQAKWDARKEEVQEAYEKILRELQKSKIDGQEFIRLRGQIEELRPLRERQTSLQKERTENEQLRRDLLAEWEDAGAEEFRALEKAAKKITKTKQLDGRVRVRVTFQGNKDALIKLLRDEIGSRLSETVDALRAKKDLSLKEFAAACRAGRSAVTKLLGVGGVQADNLAQASPDTLMRIEELDLPPTTAIELNVAPSGEDAEFKALGDLSKGQKATAVLLLLLLEADAPLIVDQPEDDLDNRFITENVVDMMRVEKRRRQFVFSTHNANIPVLGDAELILCLSAEGEAGKGHAEIRPEHMGSIDVEAVRHLVEEILEGGKEAFEMRRLKYGF